MASSCWQAHGIRPKSYEHNAIMLKFCKHVIYAFIRSSGNWEIAVESLSLSCPMNAWTRETRRSDTSHFKFILYSALLCKYGALFILQSIRGFLKNMLACARIELTSLALLAPRSANWANRLKLYKSILEFR